VVKQGQRHHRSCQEDGAAHGQAVTAGVNLIKLFFVTCEEENQLECLSQESLSSLV
jgi:hypothetical protein